MISVISKKNVSFIGQSLATKIDQDLFNKYGFQVEQLMELAGLAAAQAIASHYPKGKVAVLCGPGNNGGDGFVCARHLQQFGFHPHIVYPKKSKNELMKKLVQQCLQSDIQIDQSLSKSFDSFDLIVDALFGFSFVPPVRDPFNDIIKKATESRVHIFSIDIPSGWDVENGIPQQKDQCFVKPHAIISLTLPKNCMKNWTGPHFLGGRFVPLSLVDQYQLRMPVYPNFDQIVKLED